ncbi:MAG: flavodoxin family protein [Spirochaetes bacterium]|nr:flavodoxin family protein [Spirochaetota bacterium]
MKALIVYDSFFGNTEKIALGISKALGPKVKAKALKVGNVKMEQLIGLDLLIVGSPTRAFRPTKAITDLLKSLPSNGLKGVKVAAFDTRISPDKIKSRLLTRLVKWLGYAAEPIDSRLRKKGGSPVLPPEGFFVDDSKGPLTKGELERAAGWARQCI